MRKSYKRKANGQKVLYEERPELRGIELTAENIMNHIGDSSDIISRQLFVNGDMELPVTLFFVDGLVDSKSINDDILKPLLQESILSQSEYEEEIVNKINAGALYHKMANVRSSIDECIEDILDGHAALIFSTAKKAVTFEIKGFEKRNIYEPSSENVIKGAKDAFVEVLRVNTSLVRRKIRTQNLRIRETKVGTQTLTGIAVVYIEGLTNPNLVDEVIKRIDSIHIDGVVISGAIEEYIVDNKWSIFPQTMVTERSDKFCRNVLEGRVGVLMDGLPLSFILPATFNMFLRAPEDEANNYIVASIIRLIRYSSYVASLTIPAFYISITTFHQEMIPTNLAISIIRSKLGVPFPTFFEVIFMLISFELLLEAGLRLPRTVGQSVSIVGAVVVGQAAVSAQLLSPAVIVVIALTGIAGFTMPNQDFANAVRFWRMLLVLFSVAAGLFGLAMGLLLMAYILSRMECFGVPYLTPFVANDGKDLFYGTLIRAPLFIQKKRAKELKTTDKKPQR